MKQEIVSMFMENVVETLEDAVEDIVEDIVDGVEDIVEDIVDGVEDVIESLSEIVPHVQIMVRARDVEFMASLGWKRTVDELKMPEKKSVEKPKEVKKTKKIK